MGRDRAWDPLERLARPSTAVGLLLALFALPLLVALPLEFGPLVGDGIKWLLVAALLWIVVVVEGRPLAAIGYRRPRLSDLGWALLVAVLGVGVFVASEPLITALGLPTREGIPQPSLAYGIASAVTAGVTEEILFRGYPIERLTDVGYGPLVAGGLTWGLFTLAHAPSYPIGNLVQIALVALLLTAVYLRTRSLLPVVVGHVLIDLVGVLAYFFA